MEVVPVRNRGEHEMFADFLRILVTNMVITYPAWTIIIPKLSIRPENVNIEMQVGDRHADEHWALKRLGGNFTGREKGRRCSLDLISKVYLDRHQKSKLKIKFYLYLSNSNHQKIKKIVIWGLKLQKLYVFFTCNPMEHSLVVCTLLTHKKVANVIVWMTFWVGMNIGFLQIHGIYLKTFKLGQSKFKNAISMYN